MTRDSARCAIHVCGAGITAGKHLTLETVEVLDECSTVFGMLAAQDVAFLGQRYRSLWEPYRPGRNRSDAYREQAEMVLVAAAADPPVAYLAQGNPIVFDSITQVILGEARTRGLTVELHAAVSALDTTLLDVGCDVAPGLQVYDASYFVALDVQPRMDLACLLMQLSAFGTSYVVAGLRPAPRALLPLRDHLLRFYPLDHELRHVTSGSEPRLTQFRLDDMPSSLGAASGSLFVPPARPVTPDCTAMAGMRDPSTVALPYREPSTVH